MKPTHQIIAHCLLALSLLVLPLQNAWSMASMASCDMEMMSHDEPATQGMDTQNCPHHADMAINTDSQADRASGQDCDNDQCNNCSHAVSLMPPLPVDSNSPGAFAAPAFKNNLHSFLPYPDTPPPIIS